MFVQYHCLELFGTLAETNAPNVNFHLTGHKFTSQPALQSPRDPVSE